MKIIKALFKDPSKYLAYDFMSYLMRKLIDMKKDDEVKGILLDPKLSINLYPELWT